MYEELEKKKTKKKNGIVKQICFTEFFSFNFFFFAVVYFFFFFRVCVLLFCILNGPNPNGYALNTNFIFFNFFHIAVWDFNFVMSLFVRQSSEIYNLSQKQKNEKQEIYIIGYVKMLFDYFNKICVAIAMKMIFNNNNNQ